MLLRQKPMHTHPYTPPASTTRTRAAVSFHETPCKNPFCRGLLPAAKGPRPTTYIAAEKQPYAAIMPCPAILACTFLRANTPRPYEYDSKTQKHTAALPNFKAKQFSQPTNAFSSLGNTHRRPTHLRIRSATVLLRKTPWRPHGLLFHKRVARLRIYTLKRAIHRPTILAAHSFGQAHLAPTIMIAKSKNHAAILPLMQAKHLALTLHIGFPLRGSCHASD